MDYLAFNKLLQNIAVSTSTKINRPELTCIVQLFFYSGINQQEIVGLRVLDVVDAGGNVQEAIKNKKILRKKSKSGILEIILTSQARHAISKYLALMMQKNPALAMKRKVLFPSYRHERTIRRHLQNFNTNFSEIRGGGMQFHYVSNEINAMPLGKIYLEGGQIFRIWPRQYYANVANKKIRSGIDVNDEKQIYILISKLEEAESLNQISPAVQNQATQIIHQANEALAKIKNDQTRLNHADILTAINTKLAIYIQS